MAFRYETHLHTSQGSACGVSTGREQARFYKEQGYTGVFVTDHFFGGNTAAPRTGKWEDRIAHFVSGYEDAKQEGDRIGLDVFFGWEQGFDGDEFLIYGLTPEWLFAHPEMEHWTRAEQLKGIHEAGGCVIQAHPFRCRGYLSRILLGLDYCDGIEVANAGNMAVCDCYAAIYAREYGLLTTCGSDRHRAVTEPGMYGIEVPERFASSADMVKMVMEKRQPGLLCGEERFVFPEDRVLPLTSYMLDDKEQPVLYHPVWLKQKL